MSNVIDFTQHTDQDTTSYVTLIESEVFEPRRTLTLKQLMKRVLYEERAGGPPLSFIFDGTSLKIEKHALDVYRSSDSSEFPGIDSDATKLEGRAFESFVGEDQSITAIGTYNNTHSVLLGWFRELITQAQENDSFSQLWGEIERVRKHLEALSHLSVQITETLSGRVAIVHKEHLLPPVRTFRLFVDFENVLHPDSLIIIEFEKQVI